MSDATGTDRPYPNPKLLVDPEWLEQHLKDASLRMVDMRPYPLYERGHLPGAVHLDFPRIQSVVDGVPEMVGRPEQIEAVLSGLGVTPETTLVIYDNVYGQVAARFFWTLEYYGYPDARLLDGGWDRWALERRPVTREEPQVTPTQYKVRPQEELLATHEWVLAHLKNPEVLFVDTRSTQEYHAPDGHLPGAVNVDWMETLTFRPLPGMRPAVELEALYQGVGATKDKEVVTYCQSGARSSHTYFVLRLLGYPRVRHYDGSWLEWSLKARRGQGLPISPTEGKE